MKHKEKECGSVKSKMKKHLKSDEREIKNLMKKDKKLEHEMKPNKKK